MPELPKLLDQVGFLDGLLKTDWTIRPGGVMDSIVDFESAGRGSTPRRGACAVVLGLCWIRMRLCEGRGPGSIPGEDTG